MSVLTTLGKLTAATGLAAGAGAAAYLALVTGKVTLNLEVGRRVRPLGPLTVDIAAPREVVFEVASGPYAVRRPRAMEEKVKILDRGEGMVLAAHYTPLGTGQKGVTVETVTFTAPEQMTFKLVRGPVPYVSETFAFSETPTGCRLTYSGELGTDLWRIGERWGDLVTDTWIATVEGSLASIRTEAERRAAHG